MDELFAHISLTCPKCKRSYTRSIPVDLPRYTFICYDCGYKTVVTFDDSWTKRALPEEELLSVEDDGSG